MDANHAHEFEWNDIYTGELGDYQEPDRLILETIDGLTPGRALDVGCGAGGLVVALVHRGWRVTGIDIAPKAIRAAEAVLDAHGLQAELHVADAATWQSSDEYDLITNSFALPTQKADQAKLYRTIRESLAPGGTVLIKDFDASMKRLAAFSWVHCPNIDELLAAFDGLEIVRAEVVGTPMHHHGENDGKADDSWTAAFLHARKPTAEQPRGG